MQFAATTICFWVGSQVARSSQSSMTRCEPILLWIAGLAAIPLCIFGCVMRMTLCASSVLFPLVLVKSPRPLLYRVTARSSGCHSQKMLACSLWSQQSPCLVKENNLQAIVPVKFWCRTEYIADAFLQFLCHRSAGKGTMSIKTTVLMVYQQPLRLQRITLVGIVSV